MCSSCQEREWWWSYGCLCWCCQYIHLSLCLSDYASLRCAVSDDDDETVSVYAVDACFSSGRMALCCSVLDSSRAIEFRERDRWCIGWHTIADSHSQLSICVRMWVCQQAVEHCDDDWLDADSADTQTFYSHLMNNNIISTVWVKWIGWMCMDALMFGLLHRHSWLDAHCRNTSK